jgi:hypothetical protein
MKFFYFKKIIFDISISKRSKNIKKIILNKNKIKFEGIQFAPRSQIHSKSSDLASLKTKLTGIQFLCLEGVCFCGCFLLLKQTKEKNCLVNYKT